MSRDEAIEYVKTHDFSYARFEKYNPIIKDYVWIEDDKVVRVTCDLFNGDEKGVGYFNVSLWDIERVMLLEKLRQ